MTLKFIAEPLFVIISLLKAYFLSYLLALRIYDQNTPPYYSYIVES
jgi:hypothetical protein